MSVEANVKERYSMGAQEKQAALCCPVQYQPELLAILPEEIIEKDYGCGDPSRYVQEGDVVLDLGSGGGKVCYMAAQLVGDKGKVHGVDMTDDMLALARKYQAEMADKIGQDRVVFHKGHIQNLALDVGALEAYVAENPVSDAPSLASFEAWKTQQQVEAPLIASNSISLVISNCVLNLVGKSDRQHMLREIFRVLAPGGRVAISDIISDEYVPENLQQNKELWSGCISGAFQEEEFLQAFREEGFVNVAYDKWDEQPWQVVEGIEFRSVTLVAVKPESQNKHDAGHALLYRGPFKSITDDFGNVFEKGKRMAVSKRVFDFHTQTNSQDFVGFAPAVENNLGSMCAVAGKVRSAKDTKNGRVTSGDSAEGACC